MEKMTKEEDEKGGDTTEKDVTEAMLGVEGDTNDEYTPDEIMKLVESSSPTITKYTDGTNFSGEPSFRVRFIDDPYAIPVVVQSSTGYITINVNEESCGPSFADSDASVMASVDASGLFGCCFDNGGEKSSACNTNEVEAVEFEWNDDLLARFLGEDCL